MELESFLTTEYLGLLHKKKNPIIVSCFFKEKKLLPLF